MSEQTTSSEKKRLPVIPLLLGVELLTGFWIYLTAVDRPGALLVVLHATLGLVLVVPMLRGRLRAPGVMSVSASLVVLAGLAVLLSGMAMTVQALFFPAVSSGLDLVHLISVGMLVGSTVSHLIGKRIQRRQLVTA